MYRETTTQLEDPDEFERIPQVNRFYPAARSWKTIARHQLRWASLVPNRADRRRMRYGR